MQAMPERARRAPYRGLILLNAALLGVLGLVMMAPEAQGQNRGRAKGQYAMVAGRAQGVTESVIYVVDAANEQLVATRWDRGRKVLNTVGTRDLAADAQIRDRKGGGGGR
jgi:hypothetical protein